MFRMKRHMLKLTTCLWFNTEAEEAAKFYTNLFEGKIHRVTRYPNVGREIHGKEAGSVMTVDFELNGQQFMGLNGGREFKFNESVSFVIPCKNQDEVDQYWEKLLEGGGKESQCGWLKDRFGVSWQIVPIALNEMMNDPDKKKVERVMNAFLQMRKFDIAVLERAYQGK